MLAAVALALVLGLAIKEALAGRMTTGECVSFIGALATMTQPLRNLVNVASPVQQGLIAAQSVFQLIDAAPESNLGVFRVKRARGHIEFKNVSLRYSDERGHAVRDLSFEAKPGQTIAIVGTSGSGKSTLVNLLPRFYHPSSGRIDLDGKDVEEFELQNLRDQIAIVSQDIVLLNDTLRNNISFGKSVSDVEIERAAATARVLDFATELPAGLDTIVGERGSLLSGGQRQRIAIARAIVRGAPILILDEATGALDSETELAVQSGIEALMQGRTTLVIAHRLSTVKSADQILVMHAGAIVERGTHAELIARDGRYALLYRQQFVHSMAPEEAMS
jgi:ATP-binding cassette, subfamily B, bacterial MsbA